jgi:hypothetical protein
MIFQDKKKSWLPFAGQHFAVTFDAEQRVFRVRNWIRFSIVGHVKYRHPNAI